MLPRVKGGFVVNCILGLLERDYLRFSRIWDILSYASRGFLVRFIRGRGGIGRRVRFRSVWRQLHEGSSPFARTSKLKSRKAVLFCGFVFPSAKFAGAEAFFFRTMSRLPTSF